MPQTAIDITGNASRTRVSGTIAIQEGTILSLSAFALSAGTNPAGTWAEIGLMSGGTSQQHRTAVLDSGYIGSSSQIGWTGKLPAEPSMFVYCDVYSSESDVVRLSLLTEL
jgi:hypothetical protein